MKYREKENDSQKYKEEYVEGFEILIKNLQKKAEIIREDYVRDIFEKPDKYREEFQNMLGWPLCVHNSNEIPEVSFEKLSDEVGYSIYRLQFEILDGLKMTGLFFKMNTDKKIPLVIVQHGGSGTPERISGVYEDTTNYNDMLSRVIKHKVHAFAPQLLLWNKEQYGVEYDRMAIDSRLKRVGSSIAAVEVYGIMKILDYFEKQDYVSNFGMVGLSYGGFYTLYTTAIDTRIKSAISCSYFNKRDCYPWNDWTWFKSAERFDDAEIACLIYPRKLCIELGTDDELFEYKYGLESFEKLKKLSKNVGNDWLDFIAFKGIHEFCKDDVPIEKLVTDLQ